MGKRTLVLAATLAVTFFVVGCGGSKPVVDRHEVVTCFMANAKEDTQQVAGDLVVTVPKGTFASNTPIRITRYDTAAPTQAGFRPCQNPGCRIETGADPQNKITITPNDSSRNRTGAIDVYRYVRQVDGQWQIVGDTLSDGVIGLSSSHFGSTRSVDGIVGRLLVTSPEIETGLETLSTNSAGNSWSASIWVHGFNANVNDMHKAALWFAENYGENKPCISYGFKYDYRQRIDASAMALSDQIRAVWANGYRNIQLFAHSLGVAVTRAALEKYGAHKYVLSATLINGANNGSVWANAADIVTGLEELALNKPTSSSGSIFATFSNPVVADLKPDSDFFHGLNSVSNRRITTMYELIGTYRDTVVGLNGGCATNIPIEQKTNGVVRRYKLDGDHSSLIDTDVGLNRLTDTISKNVQANFISMNINQRGEFQEGWNYDLEMENHTDLNILVDSLLIEVFGSDGSLMTLRAVDATGNVRDDNTARCNLTLRPHSNAVIHLEEYAEPTHSVALDSVATNLQSRTLRIWMRNTQNGVNCGGQTDFFKFTHNGQSAKPPIVQRR